MPKIGKSASALPTASVSAIFSGVMPCVSCARDRVDHMALPGSARRGGGGLGGFGHRGTDATLLCDAAQAALWTATDPAGPGRRPAASRWTAAASGAVRRGPGAPRSRSRPRWPRRRGRSVLSDEYSGCSVLRPLRRRDGLMVVGVRSPSAEHGGRHGLEAPDEAGPGEALQQVVGDVDLPPEEPVAGRALVAVVVVVPALAERDDREDEAVARVVLGLVAAPCPSGGPSS